MKADNVGCLGSLAGLVGFWVGVFLKNTQLTLLGLFLMTFFFLLAFYINWSNNDKK